MGASSNQRPNVPITSINVTPLVDITLVLLIIFMVTAKLVVSRAMPMELPPAASGGEVQTIFSVSLRADGTQFVDGAAVDDDRTLLDSAQREQRAHPELRALIEADGSVSHRRVMHALDVLRQAGLTRIAFGVEQGPAIEAQRR